MQIKKFKKKTTMFLGSSYVLDNTMIFLRTLIGEMPNW